MSDNNAVYTVPPGSYIPPDDLREGSVSRRMHIIWDASVTSPVLSQQFMSAVSTMTLEQNAKPLHGSITAQRMWGILSNLRYPIVYGRNFDG